MSMKAAEIQTALVALGYQLAVSGELDDATELAVKQFQLATKPALVVDGDPGPKTQAALQKAVAAKAKATAPAPDSQDDGVTTVPMAWMPVCKMDGIVVHWTAGGHTASALDRAHYHVLIEWDGKLVRGTPSIKANAVPLSASYAAHTLHHNTGIIGVSLCCMAGAIESPFKAGASPMTRAQWDALPTILAALCRRYAIPVTPRTVLSHAEVQKTLGIPQRGKWDISRLAFDPKVQGAPACGDLFRSRTAAILG